jgi:hypothetical protein
MSRAKNLAKLIGGTSAGTSGMALPSGSTAQRPASAVAGTIRNNTTSGILEFYNGTEWKPVGSVYDTDSTSTGYFDLPSGTTGQRPASPNTGYIRNNTTSGILEFYNGTEWKPVGSVYDTDSTSTGYFDLPSGTTGQRPASPNTGYIRYNTTTSSLEVYNGSSWIAAAAVYDTDSTSTGYFDLPSGTTGQRPASPNNGYMRYNTTTGFGEVYNATTNQWLNFGTPPSIDVEYLVVAGGGGSGGHYGGNHEGGGGGAGGVSIGTLNAVTPNSALSVTVGSGGTGGQQFGTQGSNSVFSSVVSYGGGYGGGGTSAGGNGGSGGGSGWISGTARDNGTGGGVGVYPGSTYVNTSRQGYNGGAAGGSANGGGGGGGAGAAGENGGSGGRGGIGIQSSISGGTAYYGGGGGGSRHGSGSTEGGGDGGLGGGGAGQPASSGSGSGTAGTTNTGGGGGGGFSPSPISGSNGGSGIVILKYLATYTATFSAGLTVSTTSSSGYKVSIVTAGTGTVTFSV